MCCTQMCVCAVHGFVCVLYKDSCMRCIRIRACAVQGLVYASMFVGVCVCGCVCVYIYEVEPASNKVYLDFFWKKNQGIPECVFVCVCACV